MKIIASVMIGIVTSVLFLGAARSESLKFNTSGEMILKNGQKIELSGKCDVSIQEKKILGIWKQLRLNFCGQSFPLKKEMWFEVRVMSYRPEVYGTVEFKTNSIRGQIFLEQIDRSYSEYKGQRYDYPAKSICTESEVYGRKTYECIKEPAKTLTEYRWYSRIKVRFVYFAPGSTVGILIGEGRLEHEGTRVKRGDEYD